MSRFREAVLRFRKGTTDHDGDGKMGGSLKETVMVEAPKKAPKKVPAKKKAAAAKSPTPKPAERAPKERDAREQLAFDTGRRARKSAIARDQAPHGKADNLLKHWQAGWDYEDAAQGA